MKKKIRLYSSVILIGAIVFITSCKKPEACFTINNGNASAKTNEEVKFNASCSAEASDYTWNFGNGAEANGPAPVYKYARAGSYVVTLTAVNRNQSASSNQTIVIVQ
jgi:PKD repeat protein